MVYTLKEHGDLLEKESAEFVERYLINYENIWKTYIGNKGNNTKADIDNYAFDEKRQSFWESCYTILESSYLSYNIVKSGVFMNPITTFNDYENFNKNFIAFFAHFGGINDNIITANEIIGITIQKTDLSKFYNARHIVVHGKVIPMKFDELGLVEIPTLCISGETGFGWTVKSKNWKESESLKHELVHDFCYNMLEQFLNVINSIFANIYELLTSYLKENNSNIIFTYNKPILNYPSSSSGVAGSSGMASSSGVAGSGIVPNSLYGINLKS